MSHEIQTSVAVIARVGAHLEFLKQGCEELSVVRCETPFGPSNPIHIFEHGNTRFAVLSRHGETGYDVSAPFVNDRANLWGLKTLGVQKIVSWSAPGSIRDDIRPGDLVVIDDVIDETRANHYTFFENRGYGFIRQNPVFCPTLRNIFLNALPASGLRVHSGGIYVATQGPRMETPAEVRKFKVFGGDLVGMTQIPECFLAKELEMCYASICYSVNWAEGIKERPMAVGVLFEGLLDEKDKPRVDAVEAAFPSIMLDMIPTVIEAPRNCPCKDLMLRYKKRGDVTDDWTTWCD